MVPILNANCASASSRAEHRHWRLNTPSIGYFILQFRVSIQARGRPNDAGGDWYWVAQPYQISLSTWHLSINHKYQLKMPRIIWKRSLSWGDSRLSSASMYLKEVLIQPTVDPLWRLDAFLRIYVSQRGINSAHCWSSMEAWRFYS